MSGTSVSSGQHIIDAQKKSLNNWTNESMDSLVVSSLNQSIYYKENKRDVFMMEIGGKGTDKKSSTDYLGCIIQTFLPFPFY